MFLSRNGFRFWLRIQLNHTIQFISFSLSLFKYHQTEAFPEPLKFWKRRSDNRVLDQSDKFRMETFTDGYI